MNPAAVSKKRQCCVLGPIVVHEHGQEVHGPTATPEAGMQTLVSTIGLDRLLTAYYQYDRRSHCTLPFAVAQRCITAADCCPKHVELAMCFKTQSGHTVWKRRCAAKDGLELCLLLHGKAEVDLHAGIAQPRYAPDADQMSACQPLQFDFDMDDWPFFHLYHTDSKTSFTDRFWPLVRLWSTYIQHALRAHFGYVHVLCVYSGRRGVHVLVYDTRVSHMDDIAAHRSRRLAIMRYMLPSTVSKQPYSLCTGTAALHPLLLEAVDMSSGVFDDFMLRPEVEGGGGLLDTSERREAVLSTVFAPGCRRDIVYTARRRFASMTGAAYTSADYWAALRASIVAAVDGDTVLASRIEHSTLLSVMLPRADEKASAVGHLLSAPFFANHKTGRIRTPFDPANREFHPSRAPSLGGLYKRERSSVEAMRTAVDVVNNALPPMHTTACPWCAEKRVTAW